MDLPIYCIVGDRPVKAVETEDGGMDVLAYDWTTGEFRREPGYLHRVVTPDAEVDIVTEKAFEAQVALLRQRLGR